MIAVGPRPPTDHNSLDRIDGDPGRSAALGKRMASAQSARVPAKHLTLAQGSSAQFGTSQAHLRISHRASTNDSCCPRRRGVDPDRWATSLDGEPGGGSLCPTVWTCERVQEIQWGHKARLGRRAS
jgi:hypothetical protein